MRVQVLPNTTSEVELSFAGRVRIASFPGLETLDEGLYPTVRVQHVAGGLLVEDGPVTDPIRFVSLDDETITVRAGVEGEVRRFRGVIDILPGDSGLLVINELSTEQYLAGVVGQEMGAAFSAEALKAQAIAARTVTLYQLRAKGTNELAPVQAYGGFDAESPTVLRAVAETTGWVLTFDGKLFQSYYHSSCGGHTANGQFFNEREIAPLGGVDCRYCEGAPGREWSDEVSLAELELGLRSWVERRGILLGRITTLEPIVEEGAVRPFYLRVRHTNGAFEIRVGLLRELVNAAFPDKIRSTLFDVAIVRAAGAVTVARFTGKGHGHGVGFCQHGAGTMAKERDYQGILAHYYPESGLLRVY